MEDVPENGMLIMTFITLVILGTVVFPTLIILLLLAGLSWIIPVSLTAICLLLSLLIGKNIERHERAQKIRSGVKSRRTWMSLADYGASYGRIEKRSSKKKPPTTQEEDRWIYLKRILEKSNNETKNKKL
ncbi:MAG: hypothetical protein NZ879_05380 [Archaeoglobaceae archaeon]|nr:hypothetical protein [Archaeoglobaceae archaeon]MDW8118399.1 hypothetical protein [Archaeoglobaceae archaeon]